MSSGKAFSLQKALTRALKQEGRVQKERNQGTPENQQALCSRHTVASFSVWGRLIEGPWGPGMNAAGRSLSPLSGNSQAVFTQGTFDTA